MDESRSQSSSRSKTSLDSGTQRNLDTTTDSLESISELIKRLETSPYISKKPESKSTDEQASDQCNIISESSSFKRSQQVILSRQSSLKGTHSSSYESSSRKFKSLESMKIANDKSSSSIENIVNPKQDVRMQRPKTYSIARPEGKVLPNAQYFSNSDPKLYPPGYHCNGNPALLSRGVNPVQNKECVYPEQNPEQKLKDTNKVYRQDEDQLHYQYQTLHSESEQNSINQFTLPDRHEEVSHQCQVPLTSIRMAAQPIVLWSRSRETSYYHNLMPSIKTNATPMRYVQDSSLYRKSIPPIKTNETPIRYVQRLSSYQSPMFPVRMTATSRQHIQPLLPPTSTVSGGMNCSPDVVQSRQNLTPGQVLKLPDIQPQKSESQEIDNRNISNPNLEQLKMEELAKSAHYSKKNILYIDIPSKVLPGSYFPLNAIPQGGFLLRQVQPTPIQFPTPSVSSYFGSTFAPARRIIPPLPYETVRSCAKSYVYSDFHPVVTDQAVSRPAKQNNILIQSVSNAGNPIQSAIQAQIMTPQTIHYQPAIQNLTAVPQYQEPNYLRYQYGTQYKPAIQNLITDSPYQDKNHPMCQYETHYEPPMKKQYVYSQFHKPNHLMYQYKTQYESAMQNLTAEFQYQDSNHAIYEYGTSLETSGPSDML